MLVKLSLLDRAGDMIASDGADGGSRSHDEGAQRPVIASAPY